MPAAEAVAMEMEVVTSLVLREASAVRNWHGNSLYEQEEEEADQGGMNLSCLDEVPNQQSPTRSPQPVVHFN